MDDIELARAVEAAFYDELSAFGRSLVKRGLGTVEEIYAAEQERRGRAAFQVEAARRGLTSYFSQPVA